MDYGQGTPQDFGGGGIGAPKREIQTPSGNNNNFNPFGNENVSYIKFLTTKPCMSAGHL